MTTFRLIPRAAWLLLLLSQTAQGTPSVARQWNEQILGGIRRNLPNPPAHARNLFHLAVGMYDAWASYEPNCVNYLKHAKVSPLPGDIELARREAISYAAYVIIRNRFQTGDGSVTTLAELDVLMTSLGYSPPLARSTSDNSTTPAMVGKRVADRVLQWGSLDGFVARQGGGSGSAYPQVYNELVNTNWKFPMAVLGTNSWGFTNQPLGAGLPPQTSPNFWQPLALSSSISQNGIVAPGGPQTFVGVQGLSTIPFSLSRSDPTRPWLDPFGGPSWFSVPAIEITTTPTFSAPAFESSTNAQAREGALSTLRASGKLSSNTLINIAPNSIGNNLLGADDGAGHSVNPVTNSPYTDNFVKEGDYTRVLAEFWADGPASETPPGHWHVLANQVADMPGFQKRLEGTGPVVNDLEWDVKVYFALAGATHDAACAAWALKRYYSGARPITQIRWMGLKGQSTYPTQPRYSVYGLPIEEGVCEQITWDTVAPGGKHEFMLDLQMNAVVSGNSYVNQMAIFSWPGEHRLNPAPGVPATNQSAVRWMLARDWLPFQRKTFNTPAFPGYVSGHSTFSRAAAEVLTAITGSAFFPGGFHSHTFAANSLQIDLGPSANVTLGWGTYFDAADQAGQSRRYGGIHVPEDDYHGRVIGSQAGKSAYALAKAYWTGTIRDQIITPEIAVLENGDREITWQAIRGLNHKVQSSLDLTVWVDETVNRLAYDNNGQYLDESASLGRCFYRVIATERP